MEKIRWSPATLAVAVALSFIASLPVAFSSPPYPESRLHSVLQDFRAPFPDVFVAEKGDKPVALYVGAGVWSAGQSHWKRMLTKYQISYRTIGTKEILGGSLSADAFSALIMPGGASWTYLDDLGKAGGAKIRDFVSQGGGYVGICAGAYYATSHRKGDSLNGAYGIGLLQGVAYDGTSMGTAPFKDGMLSFDFLADSFAPKFQVLLLGGPSFRYTPEESDSKHIRVLARYEKIAEPAMITLEYGKGRVFLSGPHPEIEEQDLYGGLVYRDPESEWPFLSAITQFVRGGPAVK